MKAYKFKTDTYNKFVCIETCKHKNDETKIGSVSCQQCKFNKGTDMDAFRHSITWIKCALIQ